MKPLKSLTRMLLTLLLFAPNLGAAPGLLPTFLILSDGTGLADGTKRLEAEGIWVRQTMPPRIVIAEMPASINAATLPFVSHSYRSAVPLSVLEPLGPLAVAAGIQWNQRVLKDSRGGGTAQFSAMRALVSQQSLPAPTMPTVAADRVSARASWEPVSGALYYHLQLSLNPSFSPLVAETRTARSEAELALPEGDSPQTLHLRVRAVDRPDPQDASADVYGAWSPVRSLSFSPVTGNSSLPVPTPTSPVNKFESPGFTATLEWVAPAGAPTRLQISSSPDFAAPVVDEVVAGSEFNGPSAAFHLGETFYWRLKAWDENKSSWSETRQFRIGSPAHHAIDMMINPEAPR